MSECTKCHGTGRWGCDGADRCPHCDGSGLATEPVGDAGFTSYHTPVACADDGAATGPHGEHYAAKVQPVDLIDAMGWGDHWDRACVVKYVCRAGKKGDAAADLAKAAWHLERMRERLK